MLPYLSEHPGNPSGSHAAARAAKNALEEARETVAAVLGAAPGEVVFTGGGTEADNLAVKGARPGRPPGRRARRRRHDRVRAQGGARSRATGSRSRVSGSRRRRSTAGGVIDLDDLARYLDPADRARLGDGGEQRGRHGPAARRGCRGSVRERAPRARAAHRRVQAVPWVDVAAHGRGLRPRRDLRPQVRGSEGGGRARRARRTALEPRDRRRGPGAGAAGGDRERRRRGGVRRRRCASPTRGAPGRPPGSPRSATGSTTGCSTRSPTPS